MDTFQIHIWSLKTGRLLDILAGHQGPVTSLAFSPESAALASGSWDKTVRLWDVYDGRGQTEVLPHAHDVLAVAFRPDGKQIAVSTLDGQVFLWKPDDARLEGTIEGRRDMAGGKTIGDLRSASNISAGKSFKTLAYSADGALLLAGGEVNPCACTTSMVARCFAKFPSARAKRWTGPSNVWTRTGHGRRPARSFAPVGLGRRRGFGADHGACPARAAGGGGGRRRRRVEKTTAIRCNTRCSRRRVKDGPRARRRG